MKLAWIIFSLTLVIGEGRTIPSRPPDFRERIETITPTITPDTTSTTTTGMTAPEYRDYKWLVVGLGSTACIVLVLVMVTVAIKNRNHSKRQRSSESTRQTTSLNSQIPVAESETLVEERATSDDDGNDEVVHVLTTHRK